MSGPIDSGQLSTLWPPCLKERISHWLWLLGADGDIGPASANQIFCPVNLELTLKNTDLRLHLLLRLRECTVGVVGRLCGRTGKKGDLPGGKEGTQRQGPETTWPHSEDRRARLPEASLVPTGLLVLGPVPWGCLTNLAWKFQDIPLYLSNKLFLMVA